MTFVSSFRNRKIVSSPKLSHGGRIAGPTRTSLLPDVDGDNVTTPARAAFERTHPPADPPAAPKHSQAALSKNGSGALEGVHARLRFCYKPNPPKRFDKKLRRLSKNDWIVSKILVKSKPPNMIELLTKNLTQQKPSHAGWCADRYQAVRAAAGYGMSPSNPERGS